MKISKIYLILGWLGLILGSKIYIDFTRYEFEECITRVKKELKQHLSSSNFKENSVSLENSNNNNINKKNVGRGLVEKWNEKDVETWLSKNSIHSIIVGNILPCNGKVLIQLYNMEQKAPEFFYSSISSNGQINTREIALFSLCLKELFEF